MWFSRELSPKAQKKRLSGGGAGTRVCKHVGGGDGWGGSVSNFHSISPVLDLAKAEGVLANRAAGAFLPGLLLWPLVTCHFVVFLF